jgi:glycosyltransferase involved in cell wall biosynthesis
MEPAKRRRILFLVTTSDWGGVQHFVFSMAKECQSRDMSVTVAAGGDGELGKRCGDERINYVTLTTMRREISLFHDLAALYEIRMLIRELKPDVVHLNSSKMGIVGSVAADLEHVPRIIYRIGGWSFLERVGRVKRMVYLLAERWTAHRKDVIVTVHPGDEEIAKRYHIRPRHRVLTIPNGIDIPAFDAELLSRDEARRTLGLPSDATIIGTVANYYPPKNLPWYLETIAKTESLRQAQAKILFVVIGDGPERDAVESKRRELGLEETVVLPGRRDDVRSLYRVFDMFVLPSSKEGMPWTLLEAMAAGLPCVATDVGACGWMLAPDAGIIVQPFDGKAMADAIASVCDDPKRRFTLGAAARKAVETRFRWKDTLEKTIQLLL